MSAYRINPKNVKVKKPSGHPDGPFACKPILLCMGRDGCGVPTAVEVVFFEFIMRYTMNSI
jgi:hypothetical protein